MVFLVLAVLSSALVSVVMRLGTGRVKSGIGMLAVNYITCTLLSLLYLTDAPFDGGTAALGGLNGILYLTSFVVFQYSVKKSGVVLSSVFMKLGMLLPLVASILFFGEEPTLRNIFGILLACVAIVMINMSDGHSGSMDFWSLMLLLVLTGGAEGMSKVFEALFDAEFSSQFLLFTFFVALILCIAFMLYKKQSIRWGEIIYGILVGVPNFFSAKFMLRALSDVPAVIAFPSYAVATIFAVSTVGFFVFGERLKKLQWVATGIIALTLVLLNV